LSAAHKMRANLGKICSARLEAGGFARLSLMKHLQLLILINF
jgi:hypothetical protein